MLRCCNKDISCGDLWILKDIKNFTARKLYIGKCKVCGNEAATLIEKRINDGKLFVNHLKGIEAVKTIFREKKRKLVTFPNLDKKYLSGWVYGINKEIKNKKGEVTQIRQYAADFNGNRNLVKRFST